MKKDYLKKINLIPTERRKINLNLAAVVILCSVSFFL
jgi:hypothetical protein